MIGHKEGEDQIIIPMNHTIAINEKEYLIFTYFYNRSYLRIEIIAVMIGHKEREIKFE